MKWKDALLFEGIPKNRTIKIEQLTNRRSRQYAAILDESMIFSELLQKVEGACTQYAMFCKQ